MTHPHFGQTNTGLSPRPYLHAVGAEDRPRARPASDHVTEHREQVAFGDVASALAPPREPGVHHKIVPPAVVRAHYIFTPTSFSLVEMKPHFILCPFT